MNGMIRIHVSERPESVFAYVANLENAPNWVPDLISVTKLTDGDVAVDTRYSEIVQMGKQRSEAELQVTEYNPPSVFAHKGKGGPAKFTARFVMTPDGDGTLIEHYYTVHMTGVFRLLSPLTNHWVRRNTEAGMKALKSVLDNRK